MFSGQLIGVLASSLAACAVTTLGIYMISRYAAWSRKHSGYFVSFAAGVLLTVSLLHLIPRSLEINPRSPYYFLIGFLALYVLNHFINIYLCRNDGDDLAIPGLTPVLGITLHSLIDGVIYAVTFQVSIFTGALTALGMILHEFPEGVITFVLLERGGLGRRKAAGYAFLAAALSTPLGAVTAYPLISILRGRTLGALLALSAGALVYVGAAHLVPEVEEQENLSSLLTLMAGVAAGVLIIFLKR